MSGIRMDPRGSTRGFRETVGRAMAASPLAFVRARNLVTYASVAAALGATALAGGPSGRARAGALLALAALADLLDGRFARLFAADEDQRRFGVQIDSLADAVTFGMTPVVCLLQLGGLDGMWRALLVLASLVYVLVVLTRLGFYNIADDAGGFVGVPTTIAGIAWSALFFVAPGPWVPVALLILGAAMIAPIPFARPRAPVIITLVLACIGLAIAHGRAAF